LLLITNDNTPMERGLLITRHIPKDIKDYLLKRQAEIKAGCNCQVSIEATIYKIVREAKKKEEEK
jgi:hypothetical protein